MTAPDPHVDVLDGNVSQRVVAGEFVEFGDHGLVAFALSQSAMVWIRSW
ncbi:MAG: hypothetical protein ACK56F_18095 [bacterium]